jgi:hypothetical protein
MGAVIGSLFSTACGARNMRVSLNVVLFSYLSRPILDVFLNKRFIGIAGPYPYSGNGNIAGVEIELGKQEVSWRLDGTADMPDLGKTVKAANVVRLDSVPAGSRYLGVHIYPDNTVELICSKYHPDLSPRGEAFDREWQKNHAG